MGGGDANPVVESFLHHHDPYDADYSSSDNCSLDNSSRAALFTLTGGGTMSSNELSSRSNDVPVGVGVDLDLFGHCTANTSCLDRRNIMPVARKGQGCRCGLFTWGKYLLSSPHHAPFSLLLRFTLPELGSTIQWKPPSPPHTPDKHHLTGFLV